MPPLSNSSAAVSTPLAASPSEYASALSKSPISSALAALGVAPDVGLSHAQVDARHKQYGFNEVLEPRTHPLRRFLGKFWGLSAWMLELIILLRGYIEVSVVAVRIASPA